LSLENIRKDIDRIDKDLVRLLKERMDCSIKVAEVKRAHGLPIYHPERENQIIKKVTDLGGEYGEYIGEIYRFLMSCSRELQHTTISGENISLLPQSSENEDEISGQVACYGDFGAFTHLALIGAFGEDKVSPLFCDTFEKVFKAVDENLVKFGIVPVENSSAGSVSAVYDLILKYQTYIVGSVTMPVVHNLLGVKGAKLSEISTVYSHAQALSQCEEFIKEHHLTPMEYSSTAGAAKMVAEKGDKSIAAIGSDYCAAKYSLELIEQNIQSFKGNKTRFIIISKTPIASKDREKISLVFSLPHTPGSLQKILTRFSLHGLNLTKLESRAGRHGDFETCFYLDFLGDATNEKTKSLLLDLKEDLPDFAFLGNYKEIILG
jgi:chorismate mutase/prephenate dehydratase